MVKFPFYIEQAEAYVAFLPVLFYIIGNSSGRGDLDEKKPA